VEFIKKFLQIKKLIALLTTIVFCILALRNIISSTEFLSVFTMIVGFYFGSSATRQATRESKGE
jgi:hypothetical protein